MNVRGFIAKQLGFVEPSTVKDLVKAEVDMKLKQGIPAKNRPQQRSSMMIGQPIAPDMNIQDYIKAYHGWVYACVRVIAEETADMALQLFKRSSQTEFDSVDQHPVLDLLYKVNPMYTSYLLWEATTAYLELTGETFWYLVGPKNNPSEIWVLRPDWVTINDTKNSIIESYSYGPPGNRKLTIPFEQVVHFKDFNPNNWYRGYGVVKPSDKAIATDEFAADYNKNFFYNSALPGGALETDQNLEDDQRQKMRDDWESVHRGEKKAWRIAILEAGLKWQDIGMNRKEMDFTEGRRLSRDEIMAMFRVPKPLLTFDDVNRAAAKEARAILLENVITHKMKRICSFLNEFLLPRYGDDSLFFNFENPIPNDESMTLAKHKAELAGMPWRVVNEVREEEGLEPIEGGDTLYIPFSMTPIGAALSEGAKKLQRFRKLTHFNLRIPPYPFRKYQYDKTMNHLTSLVEKMIRGIIVTRQQKAKERAFVDKIIKGPVQEGQIVREADVREARWRTMVTRTDSREARYTSIMGELFNVQQAKVTQRINDELQRAAPDEYKKALGKMKSNVSTIVDVTDDDKIFAESLMNYIRGVIEAEGIQQIQAIKDGAVFFMQTRAIQQYLKKDGVKYISTINAETTEQLQEELIEAIDLQESIAQIKTRIERVYEDARGYRATRIARSEVLRATNFATNEAYVQSGVVEKKEWLTAHDERVCPWCGPMDGKTIGVKEVFFEEGDTIKGKNENGKTVTMTVGVDDVDFPPLHPNCRCTLIPIVSE